MRVRTTYGYFAGGLGVTALAAMATGLLLLMSTRPLLVRGGVAGAWVWGAPGCAVHAVWGWSGRHCWGVWKAVLGVWKAVLG